jgi:hypothetical protein
MRNFISTAVVFEETLNGKTIWMGDYSPCPEDFCWWVLSSGSRRLVIVRQCSRARRFR